LVLRGGELFPALYAILDASPEFAGPSKFSILEIAERLAGAGVELFQYRDKRGAARKIQETSAALVVRLANVRKGARLIVNDRADIAAIVRAGGVHVGQEDLAVEAARKICGGGLWVGVSTHNLEQLRAADGTSADYIAVGPVFRTGTKENPDPVVGLEFLRAARGITRKPLVAIGGITVESAQAVYEAGADSVAVIRDLMAAEDPAVRAHEYLAIAQRVRTARGAKNKGIAENG
jgi:thiamine-phosphate pyrophosphorylase